MIWGVGWDVCGGQCVVRGVGGGGVWCEGGGGGSVIFLRGRGEGGGVVGEHCVKVVCGCCFSRSCFSVCC